MGLFVILVNMILFAPLILCIVFGQRFQVSQPYVRIEQTAASYSLSFNRREMFLDPKILFRRSHLVMAMAILLFTSCSWSAFVGKTRVGRSSQGTRYLNWKTFSRTSSSSSLTVDDWSEFLLFFYSFCCCTVSSASLPWKS